MPSFQKNAFATPFGKNTFLRSTLNVKTRSATLAASTITPQSIDGNAGQKIVQAGLVLAKITVGSDAGKVGPVQAAGTNEAQTVTITGTPTGGAFKLTYDGQQTADIAFNATATDVQTALEALSNILVGDIVVTGGPGPGTPFVVTFVGTLGGENVNAMTVSHTLTGGTTPNAAVTTGTPGVGGATDGRQTLTNIVGICNTFLPWQTMDRDVEVAVIYEAAVIQARCLEYDAAGNAIALTDATAAQMFGKKHMDITFAQ